ACISCSKHLLKENIAKLEKQSPLTPEQEEKLNNKKQKLAKLLRENPNNNKDDNRDDGGDENNSEKQELEHLISTLQQTLKSIKWIPKNHPSYNEYQIQQIERQLAEAIRKYKAKFGELPSSLREDDVGGGVKIPPQVERVIF